LSGEVGFKIALPDTETARRNTDVGQSAGTAPLPDGRFFYPNHVGCVLRFEESVGLWFLGMELIYHA